MKRFLAKHQQKITGVLSCFDRVLFKGYLPIGYPAAMESFMNTKGLLLKEFKTFVTRQSACLKEHAQQMAATQGRPYLYLNKPLRKEDYVRELAKEDNIIEGLVCVLAVVERCQTFKLMYAPGKPKITTASPRCLCLYYYFLDRDLGLIHVRLQTWFPFTLQVYVNGHSWLAKQLDRRGINYRLLDNAFLWIENSEKAQRIADRFVKKRWPCLLAKLARKVNPLLQGLLAPMRYYWVSDQAEYATDLLFSTPQALHALYPQLLEHAILCFSAEDILRFLGRKLHGAFQGELLSQFTKRWPGARVKHRMKENWIKMYDKHGCVLRIETVINHPYEFKVRRRGIRKGKQVIGWFPMAKGVANLPRYAEVARAANTRYLDALAAMPDPTTATPALQTLAKPVRRSSRSYRGFNPVAKDDFALFLAVMRGEHMIGGFRNKNIRDRLFPAATDRVAARRASAKISRLLKRLHVHGLIAKFPRSRRYRVSIKGHVLMNAAIMIYRKGYPHCMKEAA